MRRFFAVLLILLSFPLVSNASEPIKIGAIFPKTGEAVYMVKEYPHFQAIRAAVRKINDGGGLLGKQLTLIEYDNKSTGIGSKLAAQQAVRDGVTAVIGSAWSSHSLAMAPVLQEAGIPMISPDSTHPSVTRVGEYIFRVCFIDPFQGRVLANFARQELSAERAVVLTNIGQTYCVGLSGFFIKAFKENGGRILWEGEYEKEPEDIARFAQKVKALNPDVIFLPGTDRDSSLIIKKFRETGITQPFLGGDAWTDRMYDYAGNSIEGNYYSAHWHKDKADALSRGFVKTFTENSGPITGAETPLAWDAVMLFADAVKQANSLDRKKIRDALAATKNFIGITGTISMDKNGDPVKSAVILRFQAGSSVFVQTIAPDPGP